MSTPLDTSTITGPVGRRGTQALASEPATPAGGADRRGEQDHDAQPVRPLPRRGGGGDEGGDDQHHAHRLEPHHHDHDQEQGEQDLQAPHGIAQAGAETRGRR